MSEETVVTGDTAVPTEQKITDEGEKTDAAATPVESKSTEEATKTDAVETKTVPIEQTKRVVPAEKGGPLKSREEELDILLARFRISVDLPGFTADKWTREHDTMAREFFTHPSERVLTMAINENKILECSFGIKDFGIKILWY